ncbi:hypothetical protein CQ054_07020 [Ochrobactrum sp. MYb29]|nr:hypothetical protein CQ054_07020 [Ochrobactrum sp. MYb29]
MSKISSHDILDDLDGLTVFETLEELIGYDLTIKLCRQHGGRDIYIPYSAADDHWLVLCIGREAADMLCKHFSVGVRSGTRLLLPMGKAQEGQKSASLICTMTDKGRTANHIASALRIHVRTVYRARKKLKETRLRFFGAQIQRMLRDGLSEDEIASKLRIPLIGLKPVIAEVQRRSTHATKAVAQ